MLNRLGSVISAIAIIAGFSWFIRYTEVPWPLIEGQELADQMAACQAINLNTGLNNYLEAIRVLGIRPDFETLTDLAINGPLSFGRRYDCFAYLSEEEAKTIISSKRYRDLQLHIAGQISKFSRL